MVAVAFQASRTDGRSDRQVIFDLAENAEPDTFFSYQELQRVLAEGLDRVPNRQRVCAAIRQANRTLQHERSRYLRVVRGQGYRVLKSNEHLPVALDMSRSATKMYKRGLTLIKSTNLNELSPSERQMHEGYGMLFAANFAMIENTNRRVNRQDALIADLHERMRRVESGDAD